MRVLTTGAIVGWGVKGKTFPHGELFDNRLSLKPCSEYKNIVIYLSLYLTLPPIKFTLSSHILRHMISGTKTLKKICIEIQRKNIRRVPTDA